MRIRRLHIRQLTDSFIDRGNARQLLTRGYREALKVLAAAKQRGVFDVRASVRPVGKA